MGGFQGVPKEQAQSCWVRALELCLGGHMCNNKDKGGGGRNEQLQSKLHLDSTMSCLGSMAVTCSSCFLGSQVSKG